MEARKELESTPHGHRTTAVARIAALWGVSPQTVYRHLAKVGAAGTRVQRPGRGPGGPSEDELITMSRFLAAAARKSGKLLGDIGRAKATLHRSGLISDAAARLSDRTWARHLKRTGLGKEALRAPSLCTELDSRHPNDWHLVDASIGVLFYLTKKGKLRFRRLDHMDPKNKPRQFARHVSSRLLLVRWVLVDHYSGAITVDYRESSGESTTDLVDFLHYAWADKGDPRWPVKGIPRHLYMDQGAPQKSTYIKSLCQALGVELHLHESSHVRADAPAARATGAVERAQEIVEQELESQWRYEPPTGGLEQIRLQARDFCVWVNSSPQYKLRRARATRSEIWMDITDEQLRLPPDLDSFRGLATSGSLERTLDAYGRVTIDSIPYKVIDCPWYPGEKLSVRRNAFDPERIQVYNPRTGETLDALRLGRRRNGRSTAAVYLGEKQPENVISARQPRHAAARVREAVAADMKAKAGMFAPRALQTNVGHHADTVDVTFAPRKGTILVPKTSARRLDVWDVLELAANRLGRPLEPHESAWIEERVDDRTEELLAIKLVEELAVHIGEPRRVLAMPTSA